MHAPARGNATFTPADTALLLSLGTMWGLSFLFIEVALRGVGPSAIHRRSWSFMDDIPWTGAVRYHRPDPQGSLFPPATA